MVARQKAIELATVVDEDCSDLGIHRFSTGDAPWNDDWRPPLYCVGSEDPKGSGTFRMYERRHFFVDGCEELPASLDAVEELLGDAHQVYCNIL